MGDHYLEFVMKPCVLMCAPEYFGVRYAINPWMEGQIGQVDSTIAMRQWTEFYNVLQSHAEVLLIDPQPHVPDLALKDLVKLGPLLHGDGGIDLADLAFHPGVDRVTDPKIFWSTH